MNCKARFVPSREVRIEPRPLQSGFLAIRIRSGESACELMFLAGCGSMVKAMRVGRGAIFYEGNDMSNRKCLACGQRPAATDDDYPALCQPCQDRAGEQV